MYQPTTQEFAYHVKVYGPQSRFGYKDFIPMLRAEEYNPGDWADLFRRAGAKFIVPVAEHHDGFAMYDCDFSQWCATKMGPQRDIVGELAEAVRQEGMVFGLSSHRAEHWWFMDGGMQFDSDVQDPRYADFYGPAQPKDTQPDSDFLQDWLARCCELVDKYQPQVVWFDWWINEAAFEPYLQKFAAYYYNRGAEWGKGVAINYKEKAFPKEAAVFDLERGQLAGVSEHFWQNDTSVSKNSWGYISHHDYKTAGSIIGDLVDVVSKNGALLLNVGPQADGTIPEPEAEILLEIGRWLKVNGEAIYGTRPWKVLGEGPTEITEGTFSDTKRSAFTSEDIRFTSKGATLYAIILAWPENGEVRIKSFAAGSELDEQQIVSISLLGSNTPVTWSRDTEALKVQLPDTKPGEYAYTLKLERQ